MREIRKIAILIDGDNADSKLIEPILAEAGKHGKVIIKRVYGDFSVSEFSKKWSKDLCNSFAIRPMQKYSYTKGKNSTDTELIIDAMDILHLVDGFCIVSSDSDYTGLAHRIREKGLFVVGIGRNQTPEAFQKACETFIFTEILEPQSENKQPEKNTEHAAESTKTAASKSAGVKAAGQINLNLINSSRKAGVKSIRKQDIDSAFDMAKDEGTELANSSRLLQTLKQSDSTFDYRNFGFNSFRKFCECLAPAYTISLGKDGTTMLLKRAE
ncbi:hypothetical protein FACS1894170_12890 [Planctomycetales bacterium]|nr:hypothetical protein FACS1894170_12890 [Planctomycetales bacterium]